AGDQPGDEPAAAGPAASAPAPAVPATRSPDTPPTPAPDRLPPGQRLQRGEWPVLHYGPGPRFKPPAWDFSVPRAPADGDAVSWSYPEFSELPRIDVVADFHCVTRFTMLDARWSGVSAAAVVELAPPAPDVTHVTVWAEYGYSSNLRIEDLLHD